MSFSSFVIIILLFNISCEALSQMAKVNDTCYAGNILCKVCWICTIGLPYKWIREINTTEDLQTKWFFYKTFYNIDVKRIKNAFILFGAENNSWKNKNETEGNISFLISLGYNYQNIT